MAINSDKKNPKNDSDESNYIKKDGENKSEEKSEESFFDKLKAGIDNFKNSAIKIEARKEKLRTLDEEFGGKETKREKEEQEKKSENENEDADVWDKLEKGQNTELPPAKEGDDFETSAQESFIHMKKKGRGKRGKLGPMTLNPDAPIKGEPVERKNPGAKLEEKVPAESTLSMVARFGKRNHENDHGGFSR